MKYPGVQVQPPGGTRSPEELVPVAIRDQILNIAGLSQDLVGADELEKDILLLRARRNSLSELRSKYPRISPIKLNSLKKALKDHGY